MTLKRYNVRLKAKHGDVLAFKGIIRHSQRESAKTSLEKEHENINQIMETCEMNQ